MIEARNLCKVFERDTKNDSNKGFKKKTKEEFFAVNDISFTANDGEILGILGPNGAGKSTLLRMLGSLLTPTSGSVVVKDKDGLEITDKIELKKRIGFLSENTKLYDKLSTHELLKIFADVYGMSKEEAEARCNEIFTVLDMDSFKDNHIEKLSTGQTQRANIARCLIHSPQIYIFDEPTLGLDIISSESIVNFMKNERNNGKTVLYSTHYMEEAQYLCDRIFMISEGKCIAFDTPENLMKQTGTNNLRDTFKTLVKESGDIDNE